MVQLMPLPAPSLLVHYNPDWFNLSGAGLSRLFLKRDYKGVSVCLIIVYLKLNKIKGIYLVSGLFAP